MQPMTCVMRRATPATDMNMKAVASAVIAGAVAGLIAALLQLWLVQPVLLHAELYESGELTHVAAASGHHHGEDQGHDHAHGHANEGGTGTDDATPTVTADHAAPGHGGFQIDPPRDGLSILFSILLYAGYGLLMLAVVLFTMSRGRQFALRDGILWGIAGFLAVQFIPALGLAPELPGMAAADLAARQIWWTGTVIASAAALWLIAFGRNWAAWGTAIALLLLPQIIGAPAPAEFTGPTPPELAAEFGARALGVGLAGWVTLGLMLFWLLSTAGAATTRQPDPTDA